MKRFIFCFIIALLPLSMRATDYYTVTADVLNVRNEPSKSGKVIGVVRTGQTVAAENQPSNGWIKIKASSLSGYVSVDYLKFSHSVDTANKIKKHRRKGGFWGWGIPILLIVIGLFVNADTPYISEYLGNGMFSSPTKEDRSGCFLAFIGIIWLGIKIYNLF